MDKRLVSLAREVDSTREKALLLRCSLARDMNCQARDAVRSLDHSCKATGRLGPRAVQTFADMIPDMPMFRRYIPDMPTLI